MANKKTNKSTIWIIIILVVVVLIYVGGQYKVKLISKDSRENMVGFETLAECEDHSKAVWISNGEYCHCGFCEAYGRIEASCRTSSLENAKIDFDYFCEGEVTPTPVIGKDMKLYKINMSTTAEKGKKTTVQITILNDGDETGSIYVESGIYADDFLDNTGDFAREAKLIDIIQCGGVGEEFVDAAKIEELKPGEQLSFSLNPIAPTKDSRLKNGKLILKEDMDIIVGLYEECGGGYLEGQFVRRNIILKEPEKEVPEKKEDGMKEFDKWWDDAKKWYEENKIVVWVIFGVIIVILIFIVFKDEEEK